jgi:hypothetical protein
MSAIRGGDASNGRSDSLLETLGMNGHRTMPNTMTTITNLRTTLLIAPYLLVAKLQLPIPPLKPF